MTSSIADLKLNVEVETVQVSSSDELFDINLDLLNAINEVCEKHSLIGINPDDCSGFELKIGVDSLPKLTVIREMMARSKSTIKSTKESK